MAQRAYLSQGTVNDPGITYNEVGVTYNDARYTYGGFAGASDVPVFSPVANQIVAKIGVGRSQGSVSDLGITYNEAGVVYNDSRYTYGGFYGVSDVVPIVAQAYNDFSQIYTVRSDSTGMSTGPGFFLFITQ